MRPQLVLLIFAIFAGGLFGPSLNNPFVFDDEEQIVNNPAILHFQVQELLRSSTFNSGGAAQAAGIYYKPVMTLNYGMTYALFGPNPIAFRIPMLALHTLSAFLLFLIFGPFLGSRLAVAMGFLFLIHPVNAEAVLYIAASQDALYMFFGLLSLYLLQRPAFRGQLGAVGLTLLLSVFSKETGALFFAITLAYAYLFLPQRWRRLAVLHFFLALFYLGLRFSLGLTGLASPQLAFHRATFWERMTTVPSIVWHYIEIYFFPWRLSLTTDYVVRTLDFKIFWLPLVGVLAFGLLLHQAARRIKSSSDRKTFRFFLLVLGFWFCLHGQILVPLDGVYADRWAYVAVMAFTGLLMTTLKGYRFTNTLRATLLFSLVAALFLARNFSRGMDWRDGLSLYQAELRVHPEDALMHNNLGVELFRRKDLRSAKVEFEKSVAINPRSSNAWSNLAAVNEQFQLFDLALTQYEKSFSVGDYSLAYENYAKLLYRLGDKEKCRQFLFERALPKYPNNALLQALKNELTP